MALMWVDILENCSDEGVDRFLNLCSVDDRTRYIDSYDGRDQLPDKMTLTAAQHVYEGWIKRNPDPGVYPISERFYKAQAEKIRACNGKPVSICNPLYRILTTNYRGPNDKGDASLEPR